jgi:hypothetical protein
MLAEPFQGGLVNGSRGFRDHLTYANVVATLALFLVVAGGSVWAASKIGSRDIKRDAVKSKHIKNGAVKQQDLGANSVGPSSLQGNAVGSDQLAPDSVGTRELKQGGVAYADVDPQALSPRLFAHVSSSGQLGESAGVESAGRTGTGQYYVRFNRDLHGCVAVSTVGFGFGPGVIGAGGTSQTRMNLDNDPNKVGITVYRKGYTFNDVEDEDVSVVVAC